MSETQPMPQAARLERRAAVARMLSARGNTVVVSGLGSPTYDLAAAGDHERNFYLWGAMGGAALIALGVALARPDLPVIAITGDGEMLMGLGAFATIALRRPPNLSIVVLDNELYGETGEQPSHTSGGVNLGAIASACGLADVRTVTTEADLGKLAERVCSMGSDTTVAIVKIEPGETPRVLPSRDGQHIKARVRGALGLASM